MTDHAELRRVAEAATPGPWSCNRHRAIVGGPTFEFTNGAAQQQIAMACWQSWMHEEELRNNAEFIAAANPKTILALLDEIDGMKASGWRNHSVNYARAEKCPQTLETAQAAWDRDQELIEEQRQQIARDSQTINQLRQGMKGDYDIDAWLEWTREKDRIKAQNDALQGALHAVQAEVDGNLRPLTRDLVNMVSGLNNGTHPNDIYEHCDEIERIIGAALKGATQ
ncbi:TPA: ead/Ea22-like family protein [Pseudomonas aeruginosa]|nr:ead/Ea22-like family protein [Pseudomonas aeruginosa]HEN8535683.1 ead/Ea22-like family protein [Pseudomonas aeruginosa]HEN8548421.1 ead/Ea22-like family protein [Pseudomonas aeruginosa]